MGQSADQIKKAIIEKKVQQPKAVETAELLDVQGFLFRVSSFEMEGWREMANHKDPQKRRLEPAKLIQISFRTQDGTPVFEELDVTLIAGLPDAEIYPLYKRCQVINGFGGEGAEAILKNFVTILGADGVYAALTAMGFRCPNCTKDGAPTSSANNGSPSSSGPAAGAPVPGSPS